MMNFGGDGAELDKLSTLTIRHGVVFLENFPLWKFPLSELEKKSNLEKRHNDGNENYSQNL